MRFGHRPVFKSILQVVSQGDARGAARLAAESWTPEPTPAAAKAVG